MKVTYSPPGEVAHTWDLSKKLMVVEYIAIEDHFGMTAPELEAALNRGSMKAFLALIWVLWKREEPTLRPGEVNLDPEFLSYEDDEEQLPKDAEDSPPASQPLRSVAGG